MSCGTGCTMPRAIGRQLVLFVGVAVADVELVVVVAGVVRFVVRDGVQDGACDWRAAGAVCRRARGGSGAGRGGGGGAVGPAGRLARSDDSGVRGVVEALRVGPSRRTWRVTTTYV